MDDGLNAAKPPLIIPGTGITRAALAAGEIRNPKDKKLHKACADFESLFIFQMLKTMRDTIPADGLLGKTAGKDVYDMMMDQKVSEELAKKGGMGLQKVLFNQLSRRVLK